VKTKNQPLFFLLFSLIFISVILTMILLTGIWKFDTEDADTEGDVGYNSSLPTVIIDAGHGGEDGGAVGRNGVLEKELNLAISEDLATLLRSSGYKVIMTRSDDRMLYDRSVDYRGRKKLLDLNARVDIAKKTEMAIFISIHMNSFTDSRYSGLQVYYSENDPTSHSLAESIQSTVCESLQKDNQRKVKSSGGKIYLLDRIDSPAVLVECGFISNPEECELLCSEKYRKELSLALFCGINRYISEVGT